MCVCIKACASLICEEYVARKQNHRIAALLDARPLMDERGCNISFLQSPIFYLSLSRNFLSYFPLIPMTCARMRTYICIYISFSLISFFGTKKIKKLKVVNRLQFVNRKFLRKVSKAKKFDVGTRYNYQKSVRERIDNFRGYTCVSVRIFLIRFFLFF